MSPPERLHVWRKANELAIRTLRTVTVGEPRAQADLARSIRATALRVPLAIERGAAGETERLFTQSMANAGRLTAHLNYLLSVYHALDAMGSSEFARLQARATQVERMLASLVMVVRRRDGGRARALSRGPSRRPPPRPSRPAAGG